MWFHDKHLLGLSLLVLRFLFNAGNRHTCIGNEGIDLGTSSAWCWQQGCMLQWRPGSDREVLWNDRQGDQYVCRVLDIRSRKLRTLHGRSITSAQTGAGRW